jgi:DNA polymerase
VRYVIYDAETRSTLNLKNVGSHVYACGPTTDVWCVSWCIVTDDIRGPLKTWLPSDPISPDIVTAAADPETVIVAFNDAFERQVEQRILHPRYGWPIFSIERRRCAQAITLTHALPAALDAVAAALQLKARKTAAGKKVMKLLAQPRKPRKGEDPTQTYWHDTPKNLAILYEYNRIDVEITAEIVTRFGFIPPHEQKVWELDAVINARGIHIDSDLLDAALNIGDQAATDLRDRIAALTDGEITSPAQTERILKWLSRQGCELPNIQDDTLLDALKRPDLAPTAKQMITLRRDGAHAAVNKLSTLRRWLGADHRIRQVYRYHGAMPGRFTSVGAQMQNLKKPTIEDIGTALEAVRSGSLAYLKTRYERPLAIVGDITRGLIVPAPGHRLFIADLSGIESRGLAWLCDQRDKLEAWRQFDRTGDPKQEPYRRFATEELKLSGAGARGIGKLADLAFGYQGAVGAWRRLAPPGDATSKQTIATYRHAWLRQHPNIAKFWATSVRQAVNAIENNGECFTVARIAFQREDRFLYMELPSGRRLSYPFARIYVDEQGKTFTFRDASGGRWEWYHVLKRRGVFGGLIAENATQALCRDIFVEAMLRLEAAGYHIVAHLHDEFVCEVREGFGDLDEFRAIITTPPAWAPDFPIAAKARIADRFIETKANTEAVEGNEDSEVAELDEAIDFEIPPDAAELHVEPASLSAASTPPMPPIDNIPPPEFDDPPASNRVELRPIATSTRMRAASCSCG